MKLWHLALAATAVAAFVFVAPAAAGSRDINIIDWAAENGNLSPNIPEQPYTQPEVNNLLGTVTWFDGGQGCTNLDHEDFEGGSIGAGGARGCTGLISSAPHACFPAGLTPGVSVVDGPPPPRGSIGTVLWGVGFFGSASKGVGANFFVDNYDVFFGPPLSAITVVEFQCNSFFGASSVIFTVYDLFGNAMGNQSLFCDGVGQNHGFETDFAVGRINAFSPSNQAEGWNDIGWGDECIAPGGGGGDCDLTPVLQALDALEAKADAAETKLDALEGKADRAEGKLDKLQNDMDNALLMLKVLIRLAITPHGQRDTNCVGPAGHPDGKDMPSICDMPIPFTNGGGNLRQR